MSRSPRIAGLLAATGLAGVALLVWRRNWMRGFPDGHLTGFERCIDPAMSLVPAALGIAAVLAIIAAVRSWRPVRGVAIVIAVALATGAGGQALLATFVTCAGFEDGWGG